MKEASDNKSSPLAALDQLQAVDFQPYIGSDFFIQFTETTTVAAQLETVFELPGNFNSDRKPFSIILQTDQKSEYYEQSIYTIDHASLGSLSLFLVPLGVRGKGMQYEAVFS